MTKPFDPLALRVGAALRRGLAAYVEAGKLLALSIGAGSSPLIGAQSGPLLSMVQSASETGAAERSAAAEGFDAGVKIRRR